MANTIPSINTPFTDKEGRISPIWHEFLRSFVAATIAGTVAGDNATTEIIAGPGLISTEAAGTSTLAVGAGNGLAVNANDVSVDINGQLSVQASLEDEVMITDRSDNFATRKTTVRSMAELASNPGGLNTYVQYNNNGIFGGDAGFIYDGAGAATLSTSLSVGGTKITEAGAVDTIHFDGTSGVSTARMQTDGAGGYFLYSHPVGIQEANAHFDGNNPIISFNVTGPSSMNIASLTTGDYGVLISGTLPLRRCVHTGVTANVAQAQGNSALTGDYCDVNTVANANDVVTLPAAMVARYCLVRNSGANILQVFPASGDDLGAGVNTSIKMNPGEHFTWIAKDSTTWYQTDGLLRHTLQATITAGTTQTQGQVPLTKDVNEVSVVANANDVVTMPTAPAYSRTITIINNGANTLQIFPATGDDLGAGVNTSVTLASGANVRYTNYNVTNWEAI